MAGVPKRPEIAAAEFAKALDCEVAAVIPFDPQLFGTAANNGQMIAEVQPKGKTTEIFGTIAAPARRAHREPRSVPLGPRAAPRPGWAGGRPERDVGEFCKSLTRQIRKQMFGKRAQYRYGDRRSGSTLPATIAAAVKAMAAAAAARAPRAGKAPAGPATRSEEYYQTKSTIFGALIEAIDLSQLSKLDNEAAREEIRDIVNEIISLKNVVMSIAEQEELLDDICNDVLGYGPLEPLLARDDIADIMVNGPARTYIEVAGKIQLTNVRFRDTAQLMNICQRIVSQVGRRVDESSPICDARLPDGSRVNVIAPPLAIDGAALTIRKFKKDKLTLDQLVRFGSISAEGARDPPDHRAGCAATS